MSYLVSEFFLNPVLRQARRFSSGFATNAAPDNISCSAPLPPTDQWSVIEEHGSASARPEHTSENMSVIGPENIITIEQILADSEPEESTEPTERTSNHYPENTATGINMASQPLASSPAKAGGSSLPEDDGMGRLRRRILAIQSQDTTQEAKAALMHHLLMEGYNRSQVQVAVREVKLRPETKHMVEQALSTGPRESYKFWNHLGDNPGGLSLKVSLSEEDKSPTFVPVKEGEIEDDARPLGCQHYRRSVKLQCATCERWYTCRLCHDAAEDHQLPRKETQHMLCMKCGCAQKVGDTCIKCGQTAARYYCAVCKLWNDDPDKSIYHCNDCGICRVGQGLGRDFFHCNKCMACIAMSIAKKHKCIERSTDRDCPICSENMFGSVTPVIFMECGHSIHRACYTDLLKTSYRCPLCNKSVVNMEIQFRNYDAAILDQPMPEEYSDTRVIVSCNDCSAKSQTAYHWLGLRCPNCRSYNTVALQLLNLPSNALPVSGSEVAALAVGAGAGAVSASHGMDGLPSPPLTAMAPPSMSAGRVVDEARPLREPQPLTPGVMLDWLPPPPALPQESSQSSMESTSTNGPAFSDRMGSPSLPPPLPLPAAARQPDESDDDGDADGDRFWDGDVLGNMLSSPGESDNDARLRGAESEESESEDDSDADGDEEDDEDDDKEDRLMLPGHR